jgi:spore germination protein KA/spore germination protein
VLTQATVAIESLMSGKTLLLIDGTPNLIALSLTKYAKRAVGRSVNEDVLKGPHDAFNETLDDNLGMLRRRAKDFDLKIEFFEIGQRTKTAVALLYVADIVKPGLAETVKTHLTSINKILTRSLRQRI